MTTPRNCVSLADELQQLGPFIALLGVNVCCARCMNLGPMILPQNPSVVVLNVGHDRELLNTRHLLLKAAGYLVESAITIQDAIHHFQSGDFDLIILCHSVREKERIYLTGLIRECGSSIPIVFVATEAEPVPQDGSADRSVGSDPARFLTGIHEALQQDRSRRK